MVRMQYSSGRLNRADLTTQIELNGLKPNQSKVSLVVACLPAGSALLTAGYCLYSSSTIFVVTTGDGVYGFTLDPLVGEFIMSHENVKVLLQQ